VSLTPPGLDVLTPRVRAADKTAVLRRVVAIHTNMGIRTQHFTPAESGTD
jgi:hypothetical protein